MIGQLPEDSVRVLELFYFAAFSQALQLSLGFCPLRPKAKDIVQRLIRSDIFSTSEYHIAVPEGDGMSLVPLMSVVDDLKPVFLKQSLDLPELLEGLIFSRVLLGRDVNLSLCFILYFLCLGHLLGSLFEAAVLTHSKGSLIAVDVQIANEQYELVLLVIILFDVMFYPLKQDVELIEPSLD